MLWEQVIIRTTPSATGLTVRFEEQSYRFLGEPEAVISYRPNSPGEYIIEEILVDGSLLETRFIVTPSDTTAISEPETGTIRNTTSEMSNITDAGDLL